MQTDFSEDATSATVDFRFANVFALGVFVAGSLVFGGLYLLIWRRLDMHLGLWFLPAFVLLVLAHEGLHAVGFLLGGARRQELRVGIDWKRLMPYAHCRVPLAVRHYRRAIVLPGLLLGVLPAALGIAFESSAWLLFGVIGFGAAGGDASVLWALRGATPERLALDHPKEVGCLLLPVDATGGDAPSAR